ncbi:MAG: hypothetical protein ACJASQ_001661 [Crocinitomicaceae bacterium]|jgi:hypothetical protein
MNSILLTSLLIAAFACTTPVNSIESKPVADVQVIDKGPTDEIYMPTFKIYGELAPTDYLDGRPEESSLTTAHGFMVLRIAGCEITGELAEDVSANNIKSNEYMIKFYGENWLSKFEVETGKKFSYPR